MTLGRPPAVTRVRGRTTRNTVAAPAVAVKAVPAATLEAAQVVAAAITGVAAVLATVPTRVGGTIRVAAGTCLAADTGAAAATATADQGTCSVEEEALARTLTTTC